MKLVSTINYLHFLNVGYILITEIVVMTTQSIINNAVERH
jgi:hypothetical protein